MIYSTERILTTHAGSLPRPDDLREMVLAKARGEPYDQATLDGRLERAVKEVVERQIEAGLDIVNDGELSKPNFTDYVSERIAGCEKRPGTGRRRLDMTARDERKFAGYFAVHPRPRFSLGETLPVCVGELRYVGQAELQGDLDNFKAALAGLTVAGAFLPANTPGTIEHWMANEHYRSDEAFLFAIAEAMREEYKAIVEAGFLIADRRSRPAGRLGLLARHDARPIIANTRRCGSTRSTTRCATFRRKRSAACVLGQLSRAPS